MGMISENSTMNTRYIMSTDKVFRVENGKWLDMGTWAEVAAELDRLRVEVERLRGLLPDAVTRDAIHFLAEDALDRKNHFDEPDIVFSWLARLESETPDD